MKITLPDVIKVIEKKEKIKFNIFKRYLRALLVVLFLVSGIFSFEIKNVTAANTSCICQVTKADGTTKEQPAAAGTGPTEEDCSTMCKSFGGHTGMYSWNGGAFKPAGAPASSTGLAASFGGGTLQTGDPRDMEKVVVSDNDNYVTKAFKLLLIGIFNLVGWLVVIAATLFSWAVDPNNMSGTYGMLNKQAVKDVWIMVRDLLNMAFIIVLLFAAFGTIFQMDKWNIKKIWLNVLIQALLVNFSYPIARIIIDISNVAFYYFIENLFSANGETAVTGNSIFASFGSVSNISSALIPENYADFSVAYLVASIIILFILGMTLMVVAALFVVRLVVLTMLIMFSPIGFVGYAVPSLNKYANDWWKNLINYSFFAPIMIFVMAIALRIMDAMKAENYESMLQQATPNAPGIQLKWIADAAFFVIPIIIMWFGIGLAKSFGVATADTVLKNVKKGGQWIAKRPAGMLWNATGIPGGVKQTKDYYAKRGIPLGRFGRRFGSDQTEETNAWVAQKIGRVPNAYNNNLLKKMGEAAKEHNMEDLDKTVLQEISRNGSEAEKLAAFEQLAKSGDITGDELKVLIKKYKSDSQIGKRLLSKVKESKPEIAFDHIEDAGEKEKAMKKFVTSDKFDAKKLGGNTLADKEFMSHVIAEGKLDQKTKDALTSKDPGNAKKLEDVTKAVAEKYVAEGKMNMDEPEHRNVQLAHLAASGTFNKEIDKDEAAKKKILKRLNKDNSSRLTFDTIDKNIQLIGATVNNSKLVDIAKGLNPKEKRKLINGLRNAPLGYGTPEERQNLLQLKAYIKTDPYLQTIK